MAIAILDIDGTLVDTNYHHALAWFRAFRRHDISLAVYRIHRHISIGGDQLVKRCVARKPVTRLCWPVRPRRTRSTTISVFESVASLGDRMDETRLR